MQRPPRTLPRRLTVAALVATLALGAAACGAKGGSSGSNTTTTPAGAKSSTTAAAQSTTTAEATTTTTTPGGASVTAAQLKGALPSLADVGSPYAIDTSADTPSKPNDPGDKAIAAACPDAADFLSSKSSSTDQKSSYITPDNRSIETDAGRDTLGMTADKIDPVITAINHCQTISYTDTDGSHVTGKLSAKRNDTFGDFGIQIAFDLVVKVNGLSIPVHATGIEWARGGLTGGVLVSSGLDQTTFAPVAADVDRIGPLATIIDANLTTLTH